MVTGTQKLIVGAGVALLAASLAAAPFRYYAVTGAAGDAHQEGTLFRPIISPPAQMQVVYGDNGRMAFVQSAELNTGGLALIWGAVVLVVAAGVALSADPKPETRKCPSCAEPVSIEAVKCRFCASELQPIRKVACLTCRAQYREDLAVCSHCGKARPQGAGGR
jgi:hypothetical protein